MPFATGARRLRLREALTSDLLVNALVLTFERRFLRPNLLLFRSGGTDQPESSGIVNAA